MGKSANNKLKYLSEFDISNLLPFDASVSASPGVSGLGSSDGMIFGVPPGG